MWLAILSVTNFVSMIHILLVLSVGSIVSSGLLVNVSFRLNTSSLPWFLLQSQAFDDVFRMGFISLRSLLIFSSVSVSAAKGGLMFLCGNEEAALRSDGGAGRYS